MIEKNFSRLASQWEEKIKAAMTRIVKEAERRLDEFIETVERLIASGRDARPKIHADLEVINSLLSDVKTDANHRQNNLPASMTPDQRFGRSHQRAGI